MIENTISHVGQTVGKTPLPHPDSANTRVAGGSDATIQVRFADILSLARQAQEADAEAIQRARGLLMSGRLTSPENIRAAAENILNLGI
jgi:hypothetical protein